MKKLWFLILTFNLLPLTSASAAVWYQTTFNDFNTGSSFVQTAIRSTDTAAYIELGRTGASELSADSQTVGLYHMNDGGPAELSSSVQGSTVVALYHFNNGPATTLTSDANTVGLWHFDEILSAPAPLPSTVVGSTVVALYHFDNPPAELSADANTVGLWHMNEASWTGAAGEVDDVSSSNNNGTAAGNATTIASGVFGRCGTFDGTGDYVDCGAAASLSPSSAITIETWVKVTGGAGAHRMIVAKGDDGTQYAISASNANKFRPHIKLVSGWYYPDGATTITLNRWYHVAETYNGSTLKLYVNGVEDVSVTYNSAISYTATNKSLRIGNMQGMAYDFPGVIDEVKISDVARSAATICQDAGGAVDSSTLGNHGGLNIATQTYTTSMTDFGNTLQFDGVNDYVNCGTAASLKVYTASFSVEAWIKLASSNNNASVIFANTIDDTGGFALVINRNGVNIDLQKSTIADQPKDYTFSLNTWYHIVAVQNYSGGAPSNAEYFINGRSIGTFVNTQAYAVVGAKSAIIGRWYQGFFNGLIDEVRISSGALSAGQIAADAGVYTPDASSYNNKGYICNASTSSEIPFSTFGKSMLFEGGLTGTTSDYVDAGVSGVPTGASVRTYEAWIKPSTLQSYQGIISYGTPSGNQVGSLMLNANKAYFAHMTVGVLGNTTLSTNRWHHIAATYNGTNITLYVNGVYDTTGAIDLNTVLNQDNVRIGRAPATASSYFYFNGNIDEPRVSNIVRSAAVICQDAGGTVDSSAFGNHGGLFIATQTYTTSMTGFGNALQFDGTDYVEISTWNANANSLNITNAITLEAWIKQDTGGTSYTIPVSKLDAYFIGGRNITDSKASFGLFWSGGGSYYLKSANTLPVSWLNNWHHLTGTYDGSVMKLYIDGVLDNLYNVTNTIIINDKPVKFGAWAVGSDKFNGLIDEVRISSGALTAGQIAADAGSYVADASGKGNFGVAVSTSGTCAALQSMWTGAGSAKFGSNALSFDGVNDYVQVSTLTSSGLDITGSSITVEGWAKTSSTNGFMIAHDDGASNRKYYLDMGSAGAGKIRWTLKTAGFAGVDTTETYNDGNWHHYSGTYNGNKVRLYIDGSEYGTGTSQSGNIASALQTPLWFGKNSSPTFYSGTLDEVRISSRALSAGEINADALGPCYVAGDFVSDVKDTGENGTVFQNIYSSSEIPTGTSLNFYVRTSSVTSPYYWTSYSGPFGDGSGLGGVTRYRYVQYRSSFTTTNTNYSALQNDCF